MHSSELAIEIAKEITDEVSIALATGREKSRRRDTSYNREWEMEG